MTDYVAPVSRERRLQAGKRSRGGQSLASGSTAEGRGPLLQRPLLTALVAGIVALLIVMTSPPGIRGVVAAAAGAVLIVLAATDLERRIIPNRVVIPATAVVLAAQAVLAPRAIGIYTGFAFGTALLFMLPGLAGRAWMGMGDVKLIAFLGAALGAGVISALMLAFLSLFPFALGTVIRRGAAGRRVMLPFGPFLALGGLIVLILPHLT